MATSYLRSTASTSFCKGGAAPYSPPISGDTQPNPAYGGRKLLDQFREKMRGRTRAQPATGQLNPWPQRVRPQRLLFSYQAWPRWVSPGNCSRWLGDS
jgi:hypothetical protein